jgi:ribonucleoside-diphosphate reductase alpha chain
MKESTGYQAASAGQQTVESSVGPGSPAPVESLLEKNERDEKDKDKPRTKKTIALAPGLTFARFFTQEGVDPFDEIEWELRHAVIGNERGEVVFEQRDVEIPKFWSQQATNIVVSKYFRGQIGTPEREHSVKQLVGRVVTTITDWARTNKYFAEEGDLQAFSDDLKHILVYQKAAFNSPVWFNCGFEKAPQCSACFINSVEDTMDSILTLARTEGMLFKFGSGTGTNLSPIRSSREPLAGGDGVGPGVVQKECAVCGRHQVGRKTAARQRWSFSTPTILTSSEFINCKVAEEKKAWASSTPATTARSPARHASVFFRTEQQRAGAGRLHARGPRRWDAGHLLSGWRGDGYLRAI